MKLAQFRRVVDGTDYSYLTILTEAEAARPTYAAAYARESEWVETTFPPRDPSEVVPEQLAKLEGAEAELRRKFADALIKIADERAKLLSLTHQTGAA